MIEDVEVSWNLSKCFVSACLNAISQVCIQLKISSKLYCSKKSKFLTVWISVFSPPNCFLGLKKAHIRFQQNFVNSWNTNWLTLIKHEWVMLDHVVASRSSVKWGCLLAVFRPECQTSPRWAAVQYVFLSGNPAPGGLGRRPQHEQCDRIKTPRTEMWTMERPANCAAKVPNLNNDVASFIQTNQERTETKMQWKF